MTHSQKKPLVSLLAYFTWCAFGCFGVVEFTAYLKFLLLSALVCAMV